MNGKLIAAMSVLLLGGCKGTNSANGAQVISHDAATAVQAAIVARNYGQAVDLAKKAAAGSPHDPVALFQLARTEALLGDEPKAYAALEGAIVAGLVQPASALADPAFDALRSSDRFAELVERASPRASPLQSIKQPGQAVEIGTRDGQDYVRAGDVVIDGGF